MYTVIGPSGITSTMTVFASIGWVSLLHSFFEVFELFVEVCEFVCGHRNKQFDQIRQIGNA